MGGFSRNTKSLLLGSVCNENSSTTPLGGGGVFTGVACETLNSGIIFVSVYSDVASATDGLSIQQSIDSVNWDYSDDYTIPAGSGKNFSINPHAKWFRIVYTNGGSAQGVFRLQSIHKTQNSKPSSHRVKDEVVGDDDVTLVKAALAGENGSGLWHNVKTTSDGNLTISDNSSGLSIAQGNVTGVSFVHKFGFASDFDTTDGMVTVWDGANDTLLGGGAMQYTYSSTANIGTISSSNAGDTQSIEIQGLDTNLDLVNQTVTLNGQSDVSLGTNLKRVFRLINTGSSDLAGVIYLRTNGSGQTGGVPNTANTVRAIINNGNNQTLMCVYTIPNNKTGYIRSWSASIAGASKSSNYRVSLWVRPLGEVFQVKDVRAISETGSSEFTKMYYEPEIVQSGSDVVIRTTAQAVGVTQAAVSGGFDVVLVDN